MDGRFNNLEKRMTNGFASIDAKFDKVDAKFDKVDAKFDKLETQVRSMSSILTALAAQNRGTGTLKK